jgi:hypothetical protein
MNLLVILVSLLLSTPAWSDAPAAVTDAQQNRHSAYVPDEYGCIWHDEFDGINCNENGCELNGEYWLFQNVNVNNEEMLYTKRQCTGYPNHYNYCVREGVFSIHARDEGGLVGCADVDCADDFGWQCESGTGCADREERFTSGRVMTKSKFEAKYGYVEVAFRLPFSRQGKSRSGLWPAFWMLDATINEGPNSCGDDPLDRSCENAWPTAGEVDILEHVSATPDMLFHNVHWDPGDNGPGWDHRSCDVRPNDACSGNMGWTQGKDIDRGYEIDWRQWNVIGIEWQENSIKWMLNGKVNSTMDTTGEEELNRAMFPIMNLAVGGAMGGDVDIEDWSDAYLEFAYIRWYQKGAENKCDLE